MSSTNSVNFFKMGEKECKKLEIKNEVINNKMSADEEPMCNCNLCYTIRCIFNFCTNFCNHDVKNKKLKLIKRQNACNIQSNNYV